MQPGAQFLSHGQKRGGGDAVAVLMQKRDEAAHVRAACAGGEVHREGGGGSGGEASPIWPLDGERVAQAPDADARDPHIPGVRLALGIVQRRHFEREGEQ